MVGSSVLVWQAMQPALFRATSASLCCNNERCRAASDWRGAEEASRTPITKSANAAASAPRETRVARERLDSCAQN